MTEEQMKEITDRIDAETDAILGPPVVYRMDVLTCKTCSYSQYVTIPVRSYVVHVTFSPGTCRNCGSVEREHKIQISPVPFETPEVTP